MLCLLLHHCPPLTLGLFPNLSKSPAPQIGWTCQIESLEGRDQLSVLQLRKWSEAKTNRGQTVDRCPTQEEGLNRQGNKARPSHLLNWILQVGGWLSRSSQSATSFCFPKVKEACSNVKEARTSIVLKDISGIQGPERVKLRRGSGQAGKPGAPLNSNVVEGPSSGYGPSPVEAAGRLPEFKWRMKESLQAQAQS